MCLDKGYDYPEVDALLAEFGFTAHIRRRGEDAQAITREAGHRARRWVVEIVFAQLTKSDVLALGTGGEDVADLHLVVRHDHAIDQQQEELALLVKGGTVEPLLDPLAEGVQ